MEGFSHYCLKHTFSLTLRGFCLQTDPKGSLPTSIVNQVNLAQPKALIIAKQLLEKKKQSNGLLRSPTASVSYQGKAALYHGTVGTVG